MDHGGPDAMDIPRHFLIGNIVAPTSLTDGFKTFILNANEQLFQLSTHLNEATVRGLCRSGRGVCPPASCLDSLLIARTGSTDSLKPFRQRGLTPR